MRSFKANWKIVPTLPKDMVFQAAKLCTGIIENEERKTFQETLINTCQEIYHDR